MINELISKGEWWLLDTTEKLKGELIYNVKDGANLEIFGSFDRSRISPVADKIILGHTIDGPITLVDCGYNNSQYETVTGQVITNYRPSFIFKGHIFNSRNEIKFNSVKFRVFNLREWLSIIGMLEEPAFNKYKSEYNKPPDVTFICYPGCSGKIKFAFNVSYPNYPFSRKIEEEAEVKFSYDSPQDFQKILNNIFVFVGFITLCSFEQSYPLQIEFFSDALFTVSKHGKLEEKRPKAIECIYQNSFYKETYKLVKGNQHLISYQSIRDQFPETIKMWYIKISESEPVIRTILSSFQDKYVFKNEKFMDVLRGLEVFHRHNFSNEVIPKAEFETKWNTFICSSPLNRLDKAWLKLKIVYGNEPTLKERLKELISIYSFPYFNERAGNIEKFCKQAKDSRNYLTHFSPHLKNKCLEGKELFDLSETLKLLLLSCIFQSIGIMPSHFQDKIQMKIY